MRFVKRPALDEPSNVYLKKRQTDADQKADAGKLNPNNHWNSSQKTKTIRVVRKVLGRMAGPTERCMYCSDSHGSDIEHFWPKANFPNRMYSWSNLLLCCTPCGRLKLDRFPLKLEMPLLIDPTIDDPWEHLDYDPELSILTARYVSGEPSEKGKSTVELLHLDRREVVEKQYRKSWTRLVRVARKHLESTQIDAECLQKELLEFDDHGLLGWCVRGNGAREAPFKALWDGAPEVLKKFRETATSSQ